jgi:hypothetical protein
VAIRPKPFVFGGRSKIAAKQAPAQFKVQCRERSPLMGHLQRLEVWPNLRGKITRVKRPFMRQFCDRNLRPTLLTRPEGHGFNPFEDARRRSFLKET